MLKTKPNQIRHYNMNSKFFHIQILLTHTKQILLSHSHSKKLTLEVQQQKKQTIAQNTQSFSL
jgi:hypothetical protein